MLRLNETVEEFGEQRDKILEKLVESKRREHGGKSFETLKKAVMKKMIDLECSLSFYEEFRMMMLYFSARYSDDHSKRYFSSPDELWDLPEYLRMRLYAEYDDLEQGADSPKKLAQSPAFLTLIRATKGLGGDISTLIQGPIHEAPHDLVSAVNEALSVISWHENLPEDEQPPRSIWWSGELLDKWFKGVRERREERYGSKKHRSSYADADDVPMMENELLSEYRPD